MDERMQDLGRRAKRAGFVWRSGCQAFAADQPIGVGSYYILCGHSLHAGRQIWREWADPQMSPVDLPAGSIPSFQNDATLGCLLAQVRKRWFDDGLFVRPPNHDSKNWRVFCGPDCVGSGDSEAAALVAALEGLARK